MKKKKRIENFKFQLDEPKQHGIVTSQSVFWRLFGKKYMTIENSPLGHIVHSEQFGYGYVIGTHGPKSDIKLSSEIINVVPSNPVDFSELINDGNSSNPDGEDLNPSSLYEAQLQRRVSP